MMVDSGRLMFLLISMTSLGWYETGKVFAHAQSIQDAFKARPLLIRAKNIVFEAYGSDEASLMKQSSLEAGLKTTSANQFLVRVQEHRKSFVYKELVLISNYVQYLPDDTFLLLLTNLELDKVLQIEGVHGVAYHLPAAMKMSTVVAEFIASDSKSANDGRRAVQSHKTDAVTIYLLIVTRLSIEDLDFFCKGYHPTKCTVREVTPGRKLAIDTDAENKGSIMVRCSAHPMVRWLQEKTKLKPMNKFASGIIQVNGNVIEQRHPF